MSEGPDFDRSAPGKSMVKVVAPVATRARRWPVWLALLLAVVALGLAIAGWISFSQAEQRATQRLDATVQVLNQRYAALSASAASKSAVDRDLQASRQNLKNFSDRLDSMQASFDELRRRSERGRDAWIKAEAAMLLLAANDQVHLNSNPQLALQALSAADARLQLLSEPQLIPVRQAIAKEQAALRAVPVADVTGMAATLASLSDAVPEFPLKRTAPVRYVAGAQPARPDVAHSTLWQRLGAGITRVANDIFTVRHRNAPIEPLLAPSQEYFLRQNLGLRLAAARAALLEHNNATFDASIQLTMRWLQAYFDTTDGGVSAALVELARMQQQNVDPPLPDISASLTLLRKLEPPSAGAP